MNHPVLFEACVESVEAAVAAQKGGANRVELCADLLEGGITPSSGAIWLARQHLNIPMHVIIRPRGGDFCYSDAEFTVMKHDVEHAKTLGADGVVIGILQPDGIIDIARTKTLITLARPMSVTFHRAFDMVRDPLAALETLIDLGVDRLLTSGQEETVWEGIDLITELVKQAQGRIIIMPGGGITERNIARIIAHSGVAEIHAAVPKMIESQMQYRHTHVFMGGALRPAEYGINTTSASGVQTLMAAKRA